MPPGVVRYGAFLEAGAIVMPGYVNIGARVGANTMVDTWATVGSCAQVGRDVRLSGGVGIGGVLEPPGARPVVIEDGSFIGSRAIVVEGVVVERESVVGAGVVLTSSTPILDVTGSAPVEHRGRVPARSVVMPGVRSKRFPAGELRRALRADHRRAHRVDRQEDELEPSPPRFRSPGLMKVGPRRLKRRLATRLLLALRRIPSPIGEEQASADHLRRGEAGSAFRRAPLAGPAIRRYGDSIVVPVLRGTGGPKIALAGHLDTVVARRGHPPPRREGDKIYGPGASDMKSGLALMIDLVEHDRQSLAGVDLTLCFYAREEGPFLENELGPVLEQDPELSVQDLAVCLEPSDNKLSLGASGSIHATVAFTGRTAHSARPWQGENAIHKAGAFLTRAPARSPPRGVIDGFLYRSVTSVTLAEGGRGRNIVPDRFELNVNHRFSPDTSLEEAQRYVEGLVGGRAEIAFKDLSPSALPHASHPLVVALRDAGVAGVEPKQAWTDVFRFAALGVPAVNFGPGVSAQAHQRNEWTTSAPLAEGRAVLLRWLGALGPRS